MLGGIIGIERELKQKAAGVRTNILIALGAALFTIFIQRRKPDAATSIEVRLKPDATY